MMCLAKDNEVHIVVVQHMNIIRLMLLSNHYYLKHLLEPVDHTQPFSGASKTTDSHR